MADSPAKRHRDRVTAAAEAARQQPGALMQGPTAYEQHMMLLQEHRLRLKNIQSEEGKAAFKRQVLPEYGPYVEGVLEAGIGAQDEVITTVLVWLIDAGAYVEALDVAAYVLRHQMALPDRFRRTTGCMVAEEIAEAALSALHTGGEFDATVLDRAAALTADHDMPDEVRAKLHLASGRALLRSGSDDAPPPADEIEQCVTHLRRAIELHGACGGKKDLERAERIQKKQAAASG